MRLGLLVPSMLLGMVTSGWADVIYSNSPPDRVTALNIAGSFIAADDFFLSSVTRIDVITFWFQRERASPSDFTGNIGWTIYVDALGKPGLGADSALYGGVPAEFTGLIPGGIFSEFRMDIEGRSTYPPAGIGCRCTSRISWELEEIFTGALAMVPVGMP